MERRSTRGFTTETSSTASYPRRGKKDPGETIDEMAASRWKGNPKKYRVKEILATFLSARCDVAGVS